MRLERVKTGLVQGRSEIAAVVAVNLEVPASRLPLEQGRPPNR